MQHILIQGETMFNTTFLNAARLDFNNNLDFAALAQLTKLTLYDSSSNTEILDRLKDQQIVITKELPVGRDLISQFPASVKLICEAGTGYNNIDIAAARERHRCLQCPQLQHRCGCATGHHFHPKSEYFA